MQERDGWYSTGNLERIKTVLRHKFFTLLEGEVATDEECERVLKQMSEVKSYSQTTSRKPRPGKHNMAKGALAPEDVAVREVRHTARPRLTVYRAGNAPSRETGPEREESNEANPLNLWVAHSQISSTPCTSDSSTISHQA